MKSLKYSFFLIILSFSLRATDDYKTIIENEVRSFMSNEKVPGVAVAVYYKDKLDFFTFGTRHKALSLPVTKDTLFGIASITKVFTSSLLAIELYEKRMHLADPIRYYFPFFELNPGTASEITLGQLATHTAGLTHYPSIVSTGSVHITKEAALNSFIHWAPLHPLGTTYSYSNWGFRLLDFALEDYNKATFEELLKRNIYEPLKMTQTYLAVPKASELLYAQGYDNADKPAFKWPDYGINPGNGLRSTIEDMAKFLMANLGYAPENLGKAMALAHQSYFAIDPSASQGLGWRILHKTPVHLIGKDGTIAGFRSYIGFTADKKVGIVILANKTPSDVPQLAQKLLQSLWSLPYILH